MNLKMKTCTITLHCTDNAGSTLQTYALQQFLIKNGIDNEVIDYRPDYLLKYGNPIKRVIKEIVFHRECKSQKIKNYKFEKTNIIETKKVYKNYDELVLDPPIADVYITGSDQIWNMSYSCGKDEAYYLNFVPDGRKKISYAASIGKDYIPENEIIKMSDFILNFNAISVREESSAMQLQRSVKQKIDCVCDPVLLLDVNDYRKIETIRLDEKYILVYLVQPSELLDSLVARIKNIYKCKVVLIYGVRKNCECDIHIRDLSPDEFLGYIDKAEFVIASSFHAMMFSHIYKKNFAIVLPYSNQARLKHFLELSGLSERIVNNFEQIKSLNPIINYKAVIPKIEKFAEYSKAFLLESIFY